MPRLTFLQLVICVLLIFSYPGRGLSVLLVFSKNQLFFFPQNQLLFSLIFYIDFYF